MRQLIYLCRRPETRPLGRGVKVDYDGCVLIVSCGHYISAITAARGETILAHIMSDGTIALAGEKEITRHKA